MLSILRSIKVLIGKDNLRDYRGIGIKRIIVTTIKLLCLSPTYSAIQTKKIVVVSRD